MTLPATLDEKLKPAAADDIRPALKALFDQFGAADGDEKGRYLGFLMALEGEPLWAIREAVREFLAGKVPDQSLQYAPTSAHLARVVRFKVKFWRDQAETKRRLQALPAPERDLTPEEIARRREKADRARRLIGAAVKPFPGANTMSADEYTAKRERWLDEATADLERARAADVSRETAP